MKEFVEQTFQSSIFGLIFVVIVGAIVGTVVVLLAGCASLIGVIVLPIVYGVAVVFRFFVLAPRLWYGLRSTVGWVLLDMQRPKAEGIFSWEDWGTSSGGSGAKSGAAVETALAKLFGPADTSEQLTCVVPQ